MKKVIHLRSSGDVLGAENVIIEIAKNSEKFGFHSIISSLKNKKDCYPEFLLKAKQQNIDTKLFELSHSYDLSVVRKIRHFIHNQKVDIIHTHGYKEDFFGFLSSKGLPIIATNHLWKGETLKSKIYFFIDQKILKRFNHIVAVSHKIQYDMHHKGILNTSVIQNGVNIGEFFPQIPDENILNEFKLKKDDFIIGMISSLTPEKGHKIALMAFENLSDTYPELKLLIVGEGPLRNELTEAINNKKFKKNIIFAGKRNNISNLLSVFNIFLLPSYQEGLPMALLEAMASGKVVVASNVGEIGNVIDHSKNGFIVEAGNAVALTNTLSGLLNNKRIHADISQNAIKTIHKNFSSNKMVQDYCNLYNKILSR